MSAIKRFFLSRAISKSTQNSTLSQKLIPFAEVKYLVLLSAFPPEASTDNLEWLSKRLNNLTKIKIFNLTSKESFVVHHSNNIQLIYFSPKDFNLFGSASHELRSSIMEEPADLLLNIHSKESIFLDYIASFLPAKLKTGFGKENISFPYTLNIQTDSITSFSESIMQAQTYIDALCGVKSEDKTIPTFEEKK